MGDEIKMKGINVMVTASGAPGAPGIIKSLILNGERKIEIIATDMNPESYGLFVAEKGFVVPPGTLNEYIPEMLEIAEKEDVNVILPLSTYELMPLSKNKIKFEDIGIKVMVTDPEPLEIANNKGKLYEFLRKRGIPTPDAIMADSRDEFEKSVFKLGYPDVPVCVKHQISKGSRGFRILKKDVDKLDMLMNYKPDNTVTTLEDMILIFEGANPFPKLVVMEYLLGKEYSVDLLVKDGEPLITIPRSRDLIKQGISFIGTVEKNEEIAEMANRIVKAIGLDYNINLQLKYSSEGIPKIIEINPRVSGTIVLCTGAGVNMPYHGVKMALGEEIPQIKPKYGTKMIRYWEEVFVSPKNRKESPAN